MITKLAGEPVKGKNIRYAIEKDGSERGRTRYTIRSKHVDG